jgi:hypothetical protein
VEASAGWFGSRNKPLQLLLVLLVALYWTCSRVASLCCRLVSLTAYCCCCCCFCRPLQITAEDEYAPLCTFLETLLTMMWCAQLGAYLAIELVAAGGCC